MCVQPTEKRARQGTSIAANGHAPRIADEAGGAQSQLDAAELLKAIEAEEPPPLDDAGIRKLIGNFDKKAAKNAEMRVKFPQEPTKFIDSEVELNTAIQVKTIMCF
jgi:beta-catenin-like protein 1